MHIKNVVNEPLRHMPNVAKTYLGRLKEPNIRNKCLIAGGLLAGAIALRSLLPPAIEDYVRWERAPLISYEVQRGDTLTEYAVGEDLDGRDIGRYTNFVTGGHSDWSRGYRPFITSDGKIFTGDTLKLPDINRDGKVGPKEK